MLTWSALVYFSVSRYRLLKTALSVVQAVSLLHYDDAEQGTKVDPSPGYPLVCINVGD